MYLIGNIVFKYTKKICTENLLLAGTVTIISGIGGSTRGKEPTKSEIPAKAWEIWEIRETSSDLLP